MTSDSLLASDEILKFSLQRKIMIENKLEMRAVYTILQHII
jgi:hypothetical protein